MQSATTSMLQEADRKKRNRPILSCVVCHERRVKCDRGKPCESCVTYGTSDRCEYAPRPNKRQRPAPPPSSPSIIQNPSIAQYLQTSPNGSNISSEAQSAALLTAPLPTLNFNLFVERFHEHTRAEATGHALHQIAYPSSSFGLFDAARKILPTIERVELLVAFYFEQLDWMYGVGDYDSVNEWLPNFLQRIKYPNLVLGSLRKGDATRLAIVLSCIVASAQIANEDLLKLFFLDTQPKRFSASSSENNLTRSAIKKSFETHLRNLLDTASEHDGSSSNIVRASLIYFSYLKNEGRNGEQGAAPWMQSIGRMVKLANLHIDPPIELGEEERQSRRRLFWTFYIFDRIICISYGSPVTVKDAEITTQEPDDEYFSAAMGKRLFICQKFRARLFSGIEGFHERLQAGITTADIKAYEVYLEEWNHSLPAPIKADLPRLEPSLRQVRYFDLERHMMQMSYNTCRGSLHRICFFPSETITMEQVTHSRKMCIESALEMVRLQESLRMRIVSDHHLRCVYVPMSTLEAAITLGLASLIELSVTSAGTGVPDNVEKYMSWAYRARDLLLTIPHDFDLAVQAVKLVSRVLSKATRIINLHALHIVTQTDSKNAIREVLCDDEGKRVTIPLLDRCYRPASQSTPVEEQLFVKVESRPNGNLTPPISSHTSDQSQASSLLDGEILPWSNADGTPSYADMGLNFFNEMAAAIQPLPQPEEALLSAPEHPVPLSGQDLDDQLDMWLASLQTVSA